MQKVLREPVYVQVEVLERSDPSIVLTLDHCWTTTSPNPHTFPQWDILINGYLILLFLSLFSLCLKDVVPKVPKPIFPLSRCPNAADPYFSQLVPLPLDLDFRGYYRRFFFKMFAFVDNASLDPLHQQVTDGSTGPLSRRKQKHCRTDMFFSPTGVSSL